MFLQSWPGGSWEATLKAAIVIVVIYVAALWLTTVFWSYRDIRQRTRDPIVQSVAVLLVLMFFLPGLWIYQILRPRYTLTELYERSLEEEALLQDLEDQTACPNCRRRVQDEFLICPSCRTSLKEPCRSCGKALSYAWLACPFCGLEKAPREGLGARPARPVAIRSQQATRPVAPASRSASVPAPARPQAAAPPSAPPARSTPTHDPFAVTRPQADDGPMIDATAEQG